MKKNINEDRLGYTIGKTNWYLKTVLNKFLKEGKCGITNEQWLVLKVIAANPGASQTQIAQKSQKDKTNITRILDLLEKIFCIERRRDERDRRVYRIHMTEQGKRVLESVNPITQKVEDICAQALTPEKVKELIISLNMICREIQKEL